MFLKMILFVNFFISILVFFKQGKERIYDKLGGESIPLVEEKKFLIYLVFVPLLVFFLFIAPSSIFLYEKKYLWSILLVSYLFILYH